MVTADKVVESCSGQDNGTQSGPRPATWIPQHHVSADGKRGFAEGVKLKPVGEETFLGHPSRSKAVLRILRRAKQGSQNQRLEGSVPLALQKGKDAANQELVASREWHRQEDGFSSIASKGTLPADPVLAHGDPLQTSDPETRLRTGHR